MKIYDPKQGWFLEAHYELTPRFNLLPIHTEPHGKPSNEVTMGELEDSIKWYEDKIEEFKSKNKSKTLLNVFIINVNILKAERTKRIKLIRGNRKNNR